MSKQKKYFTIDERKAIIDSFEDNNTVGDIARIMGFNKSSVRTVVWRYNKNGQVSSGNSNNSRPKLLSPSEKSTVIGWIDEHPEMTLRELKQKIKAILNKEVSISTIDRLIKKFSYTLKNLVLVPAKRNCPHVIECRFNYAQEFGNLIESMDNDNKLFFLDEVGFQVSMRTKRGRSLVGTVPFLTVPAVRTRNISVCAIMSKKSVFHKNIQTRPYNSASFAAFLNEVFQYCREHHLSNCVIICDNARFHKTEEISSLFAHNGHVLRFLPPYSPFLNPIENVFSKWKNIVKRANSQNEQQLMDAIQNGFLSITTEDCNSFYRKMFNYILKACLRQEINE